MLGYALLLGSRFMANAQLEPDLKYCSSRQACDSFVTAAYDRKNR